MKNLLIISFILYDYIQNKISLNTGILLKNVLVPRLSNNPFASCFFLYKSSFFSVTYSTF